MCPGAEVKGGQGCISSGALEGVGDYNFPFSNI